MIMKELKWHLDVPLLTNRFIVYDPFKAVGITGVFLLLLLIGISLVPPRTFDLKTVFTLAQLSGLVTLGLLVLMVLVMLLFFFNYFPMQFSLTDRGAMVESQSRRGKWGNRVALVLGILCGRPGLAATGLLGMAGETVSLEWREVYRINVYPQIRVISLMNSWRVVFRLYCTPDNFAEVLDLVQKKVGRGKKIQRMALLKSNLRIWFPQLRLSLLTVIAAIFLAVLPLAVLGTLKVALTITGLLLVWLPWRRFLGAAVMILTATVLILFLSQALETRQLFQEADYLDWARREGRQVEKVPEWALFKTREYEKFQTGDWLATGVSGLDLIFFGWLGLVGTRGNLGADAVRQK